MKILLSNDDGIYANGILTLADVLSRKYEVYVFAPDRERSATGHALTLHKPLRVEEVSLDCHATMACAVTGTPSDCVKIALNAVLDFRPDVMVSGINHGPNLGSDVLYSGTVSAALEGAMNGLPSIAVSLINGYEKMADFYPSAQFISDFLPHALEAGIPEHTILNVNTPAVPLVEMNGIRVTRLGTRMYDDTYERRVDPRNQVYYWLAGEIIDTGVGDDLDTVAVRNNYVSVSPVQYDLTNYKALESLEKRLSLEGSLKDLRKGASD